MINIYLQQYIKYGGIKGSDKFIALNWACDEQGVDIGFSALVHCTTASLKHKVHMVSIEHFGYFL